MSVIKCKIQLPKHKKTLCCCDLWLIFILIAFYLFNLFCGVCCWSLSFTIFFDSILLTACNYGSNYVSWIKGWHVTRQHFVYKINILSCILTKKKIYFILCVLFYFFKWILSLYFYWTDSHLKLAQYCITTSPGDKIYNINALPIRDWEQKLWKAVISIF